MFSMGKNVRAILIHLHCSTFNIWRNKGMSPAKTGNLRQGPRHHGWCTEWHHWLQDSSVGRQVVFFFFLDKMAHQLHQHFLILLPSLSAHLLPETVLGKPKLESHKANCKARLRSSPMSNGVTAGSLARNKFPQARQRAWCSLFPQSHPLPYLVQSKRGAGTCVLLGSGMQQCLPRWKHFILKTEGSP